MRDTAFLWQPRRYDSRDTAKSAAVRLEPDPARRMVRACVTCPARRPRRRRSFRWAMFAREVGVDVKVLRAAYRAERERGRAAGEPAQTGSDSAG